MTTPSIESKMVIKVDISILLHLICVEVGQSIYVL